jgi:serine/threonine-protein kinase
MSDDQWPRAKQTLNDLLEADPDDRVAWLDARCGGDAALRAEVEGLLGAYEEGPVGPDEEGGDWVTASGAAVGPATEDLQGRRVGPYRLVEEIGVGGMGVVYRAERADGAFERAVAVKLLQRRLHTGDAAARFRAERQVLASLDHPHIARLIDGGVTGGTAEGEIAGEGPDGGGRPYLVMELVEGTPITDYADTHNLGVEARLDLLGQVLGAVQAAHRQLVVHRDLKPSNVLVTETEEGAPQVKLLDFGIAKLLGEALPGPRPETRTGLHLMTPAYAAPEQVKGEEITTATDVYQLGVLAYELLAGVRPFDLSDESPAKVERIVCEEEPETPSVRAGAGPVVPDRLRGDLDVIVLKALRKEPGRRYRSVEALGTDLRRYRNGEPVEAWPATLEYRAKKFVSRNQTLVVAGVLVLLLGIAYAVTVTVQANRLAEERERARKQAEAAEQASAVLVDLFEAADPYESTDTLTAETLLRRGERRLDALENQPALRGQLLGALGRVHRSLGGYATADSLHRRALDLHSRHQDGPNRGRATGLYDLAMTKEDRGQYKVADSLHARALEMRRRLYDSPHRKIAESLHDLASVRRKRGMFSEADSLFQAALSMGKTVHGAKSTEVAEVLSDLGLLLDNQGRYAVADSMYREALSIRRERLGRHPSTATTLNNLGLALTKQNRNSTADSIYRQALSIKREQLGTDHPSTAATLHNLASVLEERGRYAAADSMYREALSIRRERLGRHPSTAVTLTSLADVRQDRGWYASAVSLQREALGMRRDILGETDPTTAEAMTDLARYLGDQARYVAAESLYREGLSIKRETLGPRDPDVAMTLNNLGLALKKQDRYVAADSMYRKSLAIKRDTAEVSEASIATTIHNRAYVLKEQSRYVAADSLFRKALRMRRTAEGPRSLAVAQTQAGRALLAKDRGRYQAAERRAQTALSIRRAKLRDDHPEIEEVIGHLAELYEAWGKPSQAEKYRTIASTGESDTE